jgi:hypothetical protein
MKQPRQHIAAQRERSRHQNTDPADRRQDDADLQIIETWLHRQEQDGEDILKHQDAERDASGQRIELALSYSTLTIMTVLLSAQATQRYRTSEWPPPIENPIPTKNRIPSTQPPAN